MLLKSPDPKESAVAELERLLAAAPGDRRARIEQELRIFRAGLKGERDAAYLIDFDFKDHAFYGVIHDLRLEVNGRVAQIDHLLIHRSLECYVLETKAFKSGLKITDEGEFLRWHDARKSFEGMPSPLAQNERHIAVLRDAFSQIEMPTRLGFRLSPTFHSYVLVSPEARIDRSDRFDSSRVIKADALRQTIIKKVDEESVLGTLGQMAKFISAESLEAIGRQLVALHRPASVDWAAKFGLADAPPTRSQAPKKPDGADEPEYPQCKECGRSGGEILYGKYGYYLKCASCLANTAIRVSCGKPGHKERVRKEGRHFYRECADCGTSSLYFVNPATGPMASR